MKLVDSNNLVSPFAGNYFCTIDGANMAFVAIAKNAVTLLKQLAVYSKTNYKTKNEDEIHQLVGYTERNGYLLSVAKSEELQRKNIIRFAVWRDPVERLISCYKYFILEKNNRIYFSYLHLYQEPSFDRFLEFVRFELSKTDPSYQDEHIRRQSDFYSLNDVDFVVPINKINNFLEEYGVRLLNEKINTTSIDFKLDDLDQINEIKHLYSRDYDIICNY